VFQLDAAVALSVVESDVDLVDEVIFADVERLRLRLARALGAGVAVAAAVGRTSAIPVRVQPSVADTAMDQAGKGKPVGLAVGGCSCGPDLLRGDEVLLRDESRMPACADSAGIAAGPSDLVARRFQVWRPV
jgi:hypothetical protein